MTRPITFGDGELLECHDQSLSDPEIAEITGVIRQPVSRTSFDAAMNGRQSCMHANAARERG
jgi:hypothetical protein